MVLPYEIGLFHGRSILRFSVLYLIQILDKLIIWLRRVVLFLLSQWIVRICQTQKEWLLDLETPHSYQQYFQSSVQRLDYLLLENLLLIVGNFFIN